MSDDNYERVYGTDWTSLDRNEAIDRAYALGVAASMGESHPGELERIRSETDTAYAQSVVDLAFEEGETEAMEAETGGIETEAAVWAALIEGKAVDGRDSAGDRTGMPAVLDRTDLLDRVDIDSTDRVSKPEFLERD